MRKTRLDDAGRHVGRHGIIAKVIREGHGRSAELLYLRRSGGRFAGQWWPVAGTCEIGEEPLAALFRELKEETGLEPEKVFSLGLEITHADTGMPLTS
jgi:8-oxo-dGTP pyrophosphatase MutT (NUDIX family)